MRQKLEDEHIYAHTTNTHDTSDKIAEIFYDNSDFRKRFAIDTITKLARYYYGTDSVTNYGKYTEKGWSSTEEEVNNPEYLYALIKYKDEDILVHIGTGEFTPDVFTRKDIPELKRLSDGKLQLFVVPSQARKSYPREKNETIYKGNVVRKFLEECTIIHSPKGGQVIPCDGKSLNLGEGNGIVDHEDVAAELEYGSIVKTIKTFEEQERKDNIYITTTSYDAIIKEIEILQKLPKKEFIRRTQREHHKKVEKITYLLLQGIVDDQEDLGHMTHEKISDMYAIIKTFDPQKLIRHQ